MMEFTMVGLECAAYLRLWGVVVALATSWNLYLEGQRDLISRIIIPYNPYSNPIYPIINLLTISPDPPSRD